MKKNRYPSISEINVTNLVDVTLVLLIIFMITAPLLRTGIDVQLPKAQAENLPADQNVVVTLTTENQLYLDDDLVSSEDFDMFLLRKFNASGGKPVLLKADKEIPYGRVIQLMDRIKTAGISNLGLIVEPGESE